jgi:hypothetical protein
MNIAYELLGISFAFLYTFVAFRLLFWSIIDYLLKKNKKIKIKKGQSFMEWLLYTRFRNEIPRILLYLYYTMISLHLISYLCVLMAITFNTFINIAQTINKNIPIIDIFILMILVIVFYSPERDLNIGRWIKKRRKKDKIKRH